MARPRSPCAPRARSVSSITSEKRMRAWTAILLGGALVAAPPPLRAQSGPDLELSPFAGGTFFLHDGPSALALEGATAAPRIVEGARFEDTWAAGLTAGLRVNEYLAVEALLSWVPTWLIGKNFGD